MNTPKPLLKCLGAKLRLMMAEDWRGEDERNTLGMAGHWLEKLGEDQSKDCDQCGRELLPDLEESTCVVCSESCQCIDRAAVYREGIPWCINCHAQILSKCEPPPMGDALCESRGQGESRAPSAHTSDANQKERSCYDCRYCGGNRPEGMVLCNHESWRHWDEEMRVFAPDFASECASYEAKHSLHNA